MPEVSVCVATFNDGEHLDEAIASVRAQTHADVELVVVDDASSDGTRDRLRALTGPGDVVMTNERNLGEARTMNRALSLARGRYVKFLHGDDVLAPDCLEQMLPIARRDRVGLVFSRRDIILAPGDAAGAEWAERYGRIHERLGPLDEVNDGLDVFRRYLDAGLLKNCLAEPSGVLVRRDVVRQIGAFHLHMAGHLDTELFMRVAAVSDVGFADAPLFRYRRHAASASSRRVARQLHFLDHAWSLEGLRRMPAVWDAEPRLRRLWLRYLKRAVVEAPAQVRLGPPGWKLARLERLAATTIASTLGYHRAIHGRIGPPPLPRRD